MSISVAQRRARLAVRHRLVPSQRTNDVVAIARDLVALHSSDPVTVYLSAAARMVQPDLQPLSDALYESRTLIRHHAMRRTLWVLTPEFARIAHAATTLPIAQRELNKLLGVIAATDLGDDPSVWLNDARAATLAVLDEHGPMTARRLGPLVPALRTPLVLDAGSNYPATVAAHTRVLLQLGFEGQLVRTRPTGSWINGEYCWSPMDDWLPGGIVGLDPAAARTQLATSWLRAFGPAPSSDLQWWTGWSGATTKSALVGAGAVEVDLVGSPAGQTGWLLADDLDPVDEPEPWVALLPGLDPTTMGWKQRDWFMPPEFVPALFDRNGNAGPTVWVDGVVVGGWVQRRNGEIAVGLLAPVSTTQRRAIDEAADVTRDLLGDTRFSVRFPSRQQVELLAGTA